MDAKVIRAIVNDVNPPIQGKPMQLTKELSSEIAGTTPFWAALLKKRDIRDADGGDEYVTGLIETFGRIYAGLKAKGMQSVLVPLALDTLYTLDEELQKNDMGLSDEYPALEMIDVKAQGAFGGGILMAYALLETAIAIMGGKKQQRPGMLPELTENRQDPGSDLSQSLAEDLLVGVPEETATPVDPAPGPQNPPPSQPANPRFSEWSAEAQKAVEQLAAQPQFSLNVYFVDDGFEIRGDVQPNLRAAARTFDLIYALFNRDARLVPGKHGGLEFSLHIASDRGKAGGLS